MTKTPIKLNNEEKLTLDKIHVITKIPKAVIKEVFFGLLKAHSIEYYGDHGIVIPYICKIKSTAISTGKVTKKGEEIKVILDAKPSESLQNEVIAILNDKVTPTEEYHKNKIKKKIESDLDINKNKTTSIFGLDDERN